jgi:hypothetical protein
MTTSNGGGGWYASGPPEIEEYDGNHYPRTPVGRPRGPDESPQAAGWAMSTPARTYLPPTNRYSNFEIAVPVSRRPFAHPNSSTPNTPATPSTSTDPHLTLISLAESYFEAAHKNGYQPAMTKGPDARAYYKLVATGLRVLEVALQVSRRWAYFVG